MSFLPLYVYFIALSFLISLIAYKGTKHSYIQLFSPFLFATLLAEFFASYRGSMDRQNLSIYNFFSVFEFLFYLFFITLIIRNRKVRLIIRLTAALYVIVSIINILFIQGMKAFHTVTYSLGCLLIVAACIYYFYELFRQPKSVKLWVDPAFWICSGLLFFYCCGFPLYAFINFWSKLKWVIKSFDGIVTILNIFLYSLFTIAFLCSKTRKYTLSPS